MLVDGIHHVATLTAHAERLVEFYTSVFDADVDVADLDSGVALTFIRLSPNVELNVFEIDGNDQAQRQSPMFERGRIDHIGLRAASIDAFEEIRRRLMARGAADGFVTDFGPVLSLFYTDPDGLEGEVCVANPDAVQGVRNPPGTPATRYLDPEPTNRKDQP